MVGEASACLDKLEIGLLKLLILALSFKSSRYLSGVALFEIKDPAFVCAQVDKTLARKLSQSLVVVEYLPVKRSLSEGAVQ